MEPLNIHQKVIDLFIRTPIVFSNYIYIYVKPNNTTHGKIENKNDLLVILAISSNNVCFYMDDTTKTFLYNMVDTSLIARFMGPTLDPPGSCRPQVGPMQAPWTLLYGTVSLRAIE